MRHIYTDASGVQQVSRMGYASFIELEDTHELYLYQIIRDVQAIHSPTQSGYHDFYLVYLAEKIWVIMNYKEVASVKPLVPIWDYLPKLNVMPSTNGTFIVLPDQQSLSVLQCNLLLAPEGPALCKSQ